MTAFVPLALSDRNRPGIASNDSFTVAIWPPLIFGYSPSPPRRGGPPGRAGSEREQVHAAGHREHRPGDVAGALGTEKGDRPRHVLGLALLLHRHALDHALVEGAQAGVGSDDA